MACPRARLPRGFTLVELLVVIAIIGILVALLLPAVQAAREAGRRTQCINHLKQFGIAIHNHHDTYKLLPTGGTTPWAGVSVTNGTPEIGTKQSTGWPYQILPFFEQTNTYKLGSTGGNSVGTNFISQFQCPSRRANAMQGAFVLMDYASATPADSPNSWDQFWYGNIWGVPTTANYKGAIVRSQTRHAPTNFASITDGTSNVMILGEKRLDSRNYSTGDWHDDQGWIDGWDPDIVRYTGYIPQQDAAGGVSGYEFGSAHPAGFCALLCDGSVRHIAFNIALQTFNDLGDRRDGNVINLD